MKRMQELRRVQEKTKTASFAVMPQEGSPTLECERVFFVFMQLKVAKSNDIKQQ